MTGRQGARGVGWVSVVLFAGLLAVPLALGTWQLQRKQWKDALLADIAARSQPAAPMQGVPEARSERDFQLIEVRGAFVAGVVRHVFISVPRQANGIGGPGYWLFQLFDVAAGQVGGPAQIYVNRGFIPEGEKARDFGAPQDVTIRGLFRLPEPRGRFSNVNDVIKNVYYVRAPEEFAGTGQGSGRQLRLDAYVDLTEQRPPPATAPLPLPLAGRLTIANRHLEYALTWYGLAATLLVIGVMFARRRRRGGEV